MPHTINYNLETHTVEITIHGTIIFNELKEIFSESSQVAKEKSTVLFLSDFREAVIRFSTLELYELPKVLSRVVTPMGINAHRLKRAIVIGTNFKDFLFSETVTLNSGQNARFFLDIDEAKQWLSEK
jgi:hypothetical protein